MKSFLKVVVLVSLKKREWFLEKGRGPQKLDCFNCQKLDQPSCVCVRISTKPKKVFLEDRLVQNKKQTVARSSSLTDS